METSNFAVEIFFKNLTWSDTKDSLHWYLNSEIAALSWYTLYKCFSIHFNTFKTILIVQLMFLNFNYQTKFLNFFTLTPGDRLHITIWKHQCTSQVNMLGSCIESHRIKSYLNKKDLLSAHANMLHIIIVVTFWLWKTNAWGWSIL
jgi:hypothetical protein